MNPIPFVEHFEAGYSVIPVITPTGAPFEKKWDRWSTERQSPEIVEAYAKKHFIPAYGLGLVCGKISGVIALDIDSESADILNLCPPSPVRKVGSKGETRFFRYSASIRGVNRKRANIGPNKDKEDFEGIEILSDGRQTIIPPSINRKTNLPYRWVTPDTLLDVKGTELPELLQEDIDKIISYIDTFNSGNSATSSAGRNDQLTRVVCAMLHQHGGESDEFIAEKLLAYDVREHSKPYFGDRSEPECRKAKGNMFDAAKAFVARHRTQLTKKGSISTDQKPTREDAWESLGLKIGKGGPAPNYDNMVKIVAGVKKISEAFWYDSFLGNIITTWGSGVARPFHESDVMSVQAFAQGVIGVTHMPFTSVWNAVLCHAKSKQRNEVKQWLSELPPHDGLARIGCFFSAYMGAEPTPYAEAVGENFFTALIARALDPGCKAENMVILEGEQGILKSSALRALIGDKWFGELVTDLGNKDAVMTIQGKWLVEVPELDALVRSEPETIKRALSTQVDSIRVPYGKTVENFPRRCLFAGTTNASGYLRDQTGGRRFWPIRCTRIELEHIKNDREQLFAEALARYLSGKWWHEVPIDASRAEVDLRTEYDPWEDVVLEWLSRADLLTERLTARRVLSDAIQIPVAQMHAGNCRRVAQLLIRLGFEHKRSGSVKYYAQKKT